jgi:hypothetical protein
LAFGRKMHQNRIVHTLRPASIPWLACAFLTLVLIVVSALAEPNPVPPGSYQNGFATVAKLTGELCQALDKTKRQHFSTTPILLDQVNAPSLGTAESSKGANGPHALTISAGCVELLNSLAHAKALDEIKQGHFKSYAAVLARNSANARSLAVQGIPETQAWDADVMNHQAGTFNQMVGALIAIDFAHHYLGHYRKYFAQRTNASGQPVPINARVTEKEWREAVLKGARNALDCGLGVDGMRSLLAAINEMPTRPEWGAWFTHAKANVSKLDRDLDVLERDFFLVEK